jgi:hypothetical protein
MQNSQTGQWYSDTSSFSIPWLVLLYMVGWLSAAKSNVYG